MASIKFFTVLSVTWVFFYHVAGPPPWERYGVLSIPDPNERASTRFARECWFVD